MIADVLQEMGITIPEAPKPLAAYVPAVESTGKLVFTSGQLPMKDGKLMYTGHLGDMVSEEDGKKAAEFALINALAAVKGAAGSLDNIKRIVKMNVFVQSAAGFGNQPEVANGASELLEKIFGEKGKHARAAVGVSMLPRNAAVELELIVQL